MYSIRFSALVLQRPGQTIGQRVHADLSYVQNTSIRLFLFRLHDPSPTRPRKKPFRGTLYLHVDPTHFMEETQTYLSTMQVIWFPIGEER